MVSTRPNSGASAREGLSGAIGRSRAEPRTAWIWRLRGGAAPHERVASRERCGAPPPSAIGAVSLGGERQKGTHAQGQFPQAPAPPRPSPASSCAGTPAEPPAVSFSGTAASPPRRTVASEGTEQWPSSLLALLQPARVGIETGGGCFRSPRRYPPSSRGTRAPDRPRGPRNSTSSSVAVPSSTSSTARAPPTAPRPRRT